MKQHCVSVAVGLVIDLFLLSVAWTGSAAPMPSWGDKPLARYFEAETEKLEAHCLNDIKSLADWNVARETYRQQLLEMLGLFPLPPRTDLKAQVTGQLEHDEFTVEKLHFQSRPGLYVTGNLYLPKKVSNPVPAILYLCGHAQVITNGISYGNKTAYQHHGIWFARNGYVCLLIDTIQLGEIQGIHHGTQRENMWWWNSRGYTPAGVEAWNAIRALDYLQSRPEVDGNRLGVTGRSGGGAYSWTVVALDDRIKVAAPVAGSTDLRNHVVNGTVEGHCDCMFFVNTYGWDYPLLAALAAPRPLLICNSDKDSIFPLDGVVRLHAKVKRVYDLCGAANKLGLLITEGPHKDTQDLQVPVFRWFNRHLKGEDPIIEMAATKLFTPPQLRVFDHLPADEHTSKTHENFVTASPAPTPPENSDEWARQRDGWQRELLEKTFRGWPKGPGTVSEMKLLGAIERNGLRLQIAEFESQPHVPLKIYFLQRTKTEKPARLTLNVLDADGWTNWLGTVRAAFHDALEDECQDMPPIPDAPARLVRLKEDLEAKQSVVAYLAPRGIGLSAWSTKPRDQVQIRRRFMLLGQTQDQMRAWDILVTVNTLPGLPFVRDLPITLQAEGLMAVNALYASIFAAHPHTLEVSGLPISHRIGPDYLNVLRVLDIPQTVALAAEKSAVKLLARDPADWAYPRSVQMQLGWPKDQLQILPAE